MENVDKTVVKWYLRPVAILLAILAVGPFAIPLVWLSPALKAWLKIVITIAIVLLTIWMINASASLYSTLSGQVEDLRKAMR
jgi:membrane protein implicated in regulation of membrane protease activity